MTQIINVWQSKPDNIKTLATLSDENKVFQMGDYCIYRKYADHYIYTYKNFAFNELAGKNIEHLKNIANDTPPPEDTQMYFLYKRAKQTLQKIKNLAQ